MEYFYSFTTYLKNKFGEKVQRLPLDAGFTCPTRDGKIGTAGCIYCNDEGFSPFANTRLPLDEQIRRSIDFARRRYKAQKYIAYFQNATNTYAPIGKLKKTYDVIRKYSAIAGLYISTRPDCVNEKTLDLIASYCEDYDVCIEYGLQSIHDRTLRFLGRGHTSHDFVRAVELTAGRHIKSAAHVILGLPGETKEDMLKTAEKIAPLPVNGMKFHMLHVLKDTPLERYYKKNKITLLTQPEYVDIICDFLELVSPERVIFRLISDARDDMLIAPKWINRKSEVIEAIKNEFKRRGTKQGSRLPSFPATAYIKIQKQSPGGENEVFQ